MSVVVTGARVCCRKAGPRLCEPQQRSAFAGRRIFLYVFLINECSGSADPRSSHSPDRHSPDAQLFPPKFRRLRTYSDLFASNSQGVYPKPDDPLRAPRKN
jgi:hypothetical protein